MQEDIFTVGGGVKPFRIPGLVAESISQDLATKLLSNIPNYEKEPTVYVKQSNMSPNRDGSKENPFNTVSEAMLYAGKFYGLYIKDLIIKFLEDYNDPYELITLQHQPFHSLQIDGEGFNVILPSIKQYVGRVFIFNCTIEPRSNQNYGIRAYDQSCLTLQNCTIDCQHYGKQANSVIRCGGKSSVTVYNCTIRNYISSFATSIFYTLNDGLMYILGNILFENMTGYIGSLVYANNTSQMQLDSSTKFLGSNLNTKKYEVREGSVINLNNMGESIFEIATQPGFKDETSIIC